MMMQTRSLLNLSLLALVCLMLTAFMLRSTYFLSDMTTTIMAVSSSKPAEKVISVPLRDIMRSPVTLKQDDPSLIKIIKEEFLNHPSTLPYDLSGNTDNPSKGQSLKIRELLGNKKNGFFVECGALDGETRSNSLVFEKTLGWSGVLIEGDPKNFEMVSRKNRKAWTVSACLSTVPYPNVVMFEQRFNVGKISDVSLSSGHSAHDDALAGFAQVQCLPIYSILAALNTTSVDYFSLDVEGHELEVLKTIPWDKVNITTLSVEFIHGKDGKAALREYMESQGYSVYAEVTFPGSLANDFIFYHPVLLKKELV